MIEQIDADLKTAMQARDERRVSTLRLVKAALINARIAAKHELSEAEAIAVLQKEAKQRQEAADLYEEKAQPERAAAERAEADIINRYLPARLNDEELQTLIEAAVAATQATSPAQMGIVMAELRPQTAGRADGAQLAAKVRDYLTQQPSA